MDGSGKLSPGSLKKRAMTISDDPAVRDLSARLTKKIKQVMKKKREQKASRKLKKLIVKKGG